MKTLFIIALLFYVAGTVFSGKTKTSYVLAFLGSAAAFLTGCFRWPGQPFCGIFT